MNLKTPNKKTVRKIRLMRFIDYHIRQKVNNAFYKAYPDIEEEELRQDLEILYTAIVSKDLSIIET